MPLNPEALEKVWKPLRNAKCRECPLHKEAQTVCLMGDGPVPAEVMVIGEAPGYREDEIHKPFAGRAGQYLDDVLESTGLKREDLYITNAVKCRPPENRTPSKTEYKACRHYLDSELEVVNPKFIVTLGNGGLTLLKRSGIMKHRGEVTPFGDAEVFSTIHPAAVLRNPRLEPLFKADIATASRLVRGEDTKVLPVRVHLVRSKRGVQSLCQAILSAKAVAYDLENTGLDENEPGAQVVTIAVATRRDEAWVVPINHPEHTWKRPQDVLGVIGRALLYSSAKRIAHNGKYDDRWLQKFTGLPIFCDFDTMVAAHILDENQFKGLKVLGTLHLGVMGWGIDTKDIQNQPLRKVARYNAKDAAYTLQLYSLFRKELLRAGNERTLRIFVKLLKPASQALTIVERNGIWLDKKRLSKRLIQVNVKLDKIHKKLTKAFGQEANWNSPVQLGELLFKKMKIPILELTPKGAPSTKESVLLQLRHKYPQVDLLMEWRKWFKWRSTYLERWASVMDENDRMHPNYKLTGTVTGRLSSGKDDEAAKVGERGLNVQQVPRDPFIRSIIGAAPGWSFVEADFSQIELRVAAFISGDAHMQRLFLLGEDIHLSTAVQVTGKRPQDITKEERKKAKAVNFGFLYGMGAKKFILYARDNYDVEVTLEEAEAVRERFFQTYPALRPWHERQRRLANRYHRVQSPIGRIRHLPDILSPDEDVRAEAERQAINSPVQSMASDMMLLGLTMLVQEMPSDEARVVGTIHDSGLFEIRTDRVDYWTPRLHEVLENLPLEAKFGCRFTVPIKVDVTVGKHWGEGEAA